MFDVIVAPLSSSTARSGQDKKIPNESEGSSRAEVEGESKEAGGHSMASPSNDETSNSGYTSPIQSVQHTPQLAFLPTKFRKLVWIKRNDFVIVECGDEEDGDQKQQTEKREQNTAGGGFRYVINHILYKAQVKHIKTKGLWPDDPFFAETDELQSKTAVAERQTQVEPKKTQDPKVVEGDGNEQEFESESDDEEQYRANGHEDEAIVFDDPLADEYMVNTNRIAAMRIDDSSSEEESD